jgi:hypothetical protein
MTFYQIIGVTAHLWKNFISNRRANIHLFLENFNILLAASFFTVEPAIAGFLLKKGPGRLNNGTTT